MAPMPAKAPPPMASADDADPAAGGSTDDTGGGDQDAGDDQSGQVLCTILKNPDGGYTLVAGDEDDGTEGGDMADGGGDDMGGDMGAKPQGQSFSEPGALLKGVLDLLNKDAAANGGGTQSNFEAGFSGSSAPTPKTAMPPKM